MKYIAHRGLSSMAPENSIPAFELAALSEVYFGIECDVHQTKDNQFVIFHDDNLKRMTKTDILLNQLSYDELQLITLKAGKNIKKYPGLRIPLLKDYLSICLKGNKTAVIEIKQLNEISEVIPLLNMIETYGGLSVIIISFNMNYLKFIRAMSDIPLHFLASTLNEDVIYDSRAHKLDLSLDKKIVNQTLVKRLKKKGFQIAVWTVDFIRQAKLFEKMGVDYITSDKL